MSDAGGPPVDPEVEARAGSSLSDAARRDIDVIAKGGAVQIVGQVVQRGSAMVFTSAASHLLGPGGYGLYRLVSQIVGVLGQFAMLGFNYGTMRFMAKGRAAKDPAAVKGALATGLLGTIVAGTIVLALTYLFTDRIVDLFTDPGQKNIAELTDLLYLAAPYVLLFACLQTIRYGTQAYKSMVPSVMAGNIVQPGVRLVLGIGLILVGLDQAGMVWALNIGVVAGIGVAVWYLDRLMTPAQRTAPVRFGFGPMLKFSLPQAGASLLGVQSLGLGILILGIFETDRAVGLFGIALSLQGPGNVFLGGIVNIWAPVVSDLYDRGAIDRLGSLYQTINRWIATFSFPVFAALMIEPDVFVRLFAGPRAASAAPVVAILALGNLFYTGTGPTGYVISMTGYPIVNFINSVVSVGLYIGLGWWLVPEHGLVGMAWTDAIVTALVNSVRVVEAKLLVGVQPFGRTFYKPCLATAAGAAVLLLWNQAVGDSIPLDLTGVALGAVAYVYTLKRLGMDEEERHVIERIRARAFKRGKKD